MAQWFCRPHLWACVARTPSPSDQLVVQRTRRWSEALTDAADETPAAQHPAADVARCRQRLRNQVPCPACRELRVASGRAAALVAAGLLEPETARRYQAGTGVCWRGLPSLIAAGGLEVARTALEAARAQLAVLTWALDEVWRKQSWDTRHEAPGPEVGVTARAAAYLAGSEHGLESLAVEPLALRAPSRTDGVGSVEFASDGRAARPPADEAEAIR